MSEHEVKLTSEEREALQDWWDEETTASVELAFPIVARLIAARLADAEARAEAAALERAADDVLTEFDPPIEACIWASEWLRDRAARLRGDQ